MQETTTTLGAEFAHALSEKDFDRLSELLHPEIEFRAVTPRRFWEADDSATVISDVLRQWFKDSDEIESLEQLDGDAFADRERVGYRFSVRNPEGHFLVEQQAYISERDGRIGWMRVVCAGYRPTAEPGDQAT
jgi:hypothetical protein